MQQFPELKFPTIDLEKELLNWSSPSKKIYGSHDTKNFQSSLAISRIKSTLFLICSKVSLKNVPEGILDDNLVSFDSKNGQPGSSSNSDPSRNVNATKSTKIKPDLTSILKPPSCKMDSLSPGVIAVLEILSQLYQLFKETPPFPGQRRYGNMACRDWHDKITGNISSILDSTLKPLFLKLKLKNSELQYKGFKTEIQYYLLGSFGSRERLDFGTGHELSFMAFLGGLLMVGILSPEASTGQEILITLGKYYDLMKTLILSYTLEPAGSHGVWGLDDHFHLIYIVGACQLVDFKESFMGIESTDDSDVSTITTTIMGHRGRGRNPGGSRNPAVLNHRLGLTPTSVFDVNVLQTQPGRR
ncbi:unnamed protein product [Ambrosiozyma monospora]|uniref:Serine/threonine-protein phosphatase 2A activator n=1 Tax=Ambrosiozyma monospora TaxID=43982 RepID=A0A9W6Z7B4_AMBMO|nr:unnamed protein product [Ambrosiozyma monospora]